MSKKMKNIAQSEVLTLREQISYQEGQVVSKTLTQNQAVSITLFSFAKGEEISTHESGGDAFVTCLDGIGKITIDGVEYLLHEGESIVMPAGHPHAVYGQEAFKMLLVVLFHFLQILPDYILQVPARISVLWFHKLHRGFPVLHDWIYK